jgi:serine/threonine-protein kinase
MTTPHVGAQIAGYRIDGVVGSGGMGTVYEAIQLALDRRVALKVLTPALGESPGFRERFRREATLQAALEHPNVVPIYEAGESDEGLFIAMRLVRGGDLKQLAGPAGMEPLRLLAILEQAASALDAAHASGLVHRDVKPQNILVEDGDRAFLADFGLTRTASERRSTVSGYTGSLDYAAPELIRGEPAGPSADLYAFAAVLLEALTGDVPFPVETEAALLYAHLSDEPPRPSERQPGLPPSLDAVIARGLAKRPEERYRTAGELVAAARRALDDPRPAPAPRTFSETVVDAPVLRAAPVIAVEPAKGKRPWAVIGLAIVVLLALFAGAFGIGRVLAGGAPARGHVRSGPLALSFPSGDWAPATAPAIPGLALQNVVALRSKDAKRPATLVAGIAPSAQGPGLLPPALRSQLTAAAPAHAVRAGSLQGLDYPSLPAGHVPWQTSLLLVPTSRGAAAVACLVPRVLDAGQSAGDCEPVAATLELHGLRALPLGQSSAYAARVSSILTLLDGERLAARRQLAGAATPSEQARAASAAAVGYGTAASSLARVAPSPLARPAQEALVSVLRTTAAVYRTVAQAAGAVDAAAYARGTRRVDADERAVDAAIARLAGIKAG